MKASWNISGEMDSSDACSSGSSPNSPGGVPLTPSTDNVFNHVRKQPQPQPQFAPLEEATHFPFGDDLGTSVWASKKREPPSNAAPGAQSEWSGFGVSTAANSSSLWDTTTPSWTTATNATSPLFQGNPLWNTPVQDNNLIPSIWTNDPIWTTSISSSDSSLLDISGTASNTAVPNADVPGTFDPFDSFRSSIWGQHSNGSLWNTANKQDEDRKD
uniref:Uncharacterized protein LOC102808318 n=1 Tax=Saccoglossus kowalevskii TaxID=10224 RepID=A0ABM0MQJ1_SACKO|nr:PREDICTED: uncharacterized protein LOC102808318 [Saccoglossus kowalevskii]